MRTDDISTFNAGCNAFVVYDERDIQRAVEAFARIYSLAFAMTGDELTAQQLQQETMNETMAAVAALHFEEFPDLLLFDRMVDAQFIHQCRLFFAGLSKQF